MKHIGTLAIVVFLMVGCSGKAKHRHNNTDTLSDDTTTIAQDSLSIASPAEAEIAADTTAELNSYCKLFVKYDSIAKAAFRERREQGFDKFYDDLGFYKMVDPSGKYKSVAEAEKECSLLWDLSLPGAALPAAEMDSQAWVLGWPIWSRDPSSFVNVLSEGAEKVTGASVGSRPTVRERLGRSPLAAH